MVADNYLRAGHIGRKIMLPRDWERLDEGENEDVYHHTLAEILEVMTTIHLEKKRFIGSEGLIGSFKLRISSLTLSWGTCKLLIEMLRKSWHMFSPNLGNEFVKGCRESTI